MSELREKLVNFMTAPPAQTSPAHSALRELLPAIVERLEEHEAVIHPTAHINGTQGTPFTAEARSRGEFNVEYIATAPVSRANEVAESIRGLRTFILDGQPYRIIESDWRSTDPGNLHLKLQRI